MRRQLCKTSAVALIAERLLLGVVAQKPCTLASLSLRYQDWPVDLVPPFRPEIYDYTAMLDFSMESFSVDVRPASGCDVDQAPVKPQIVQIGGSATIRMFARRPETGAKMAYTIKATRLLGSETELQSLRVLGGELSPRFEPTVRTYTVRLSPQYDRTLVYFTLRDNEQRLRSSAKAQFPTGSTLPAAAAASSSSQLAASNTGAPATLSGKSNTTGSKKRLLLSTFDEASWRRLSASTEVDQGATGEIQYKESYETFPVDVGFSRQLVLTVQCADPTQANIGTYAMTVIRPGCPSSSPYFDPHKNFCVNNCPAEFYRNREINRCSKCNTNCVICESLLQCRRCRPDTADYSYVIQPDGSCREQANHIFKKYWWWCVGFGVFLVFLLCIGCIGICQCLCGGSGKTSRGQPYELDSDDSEVEFADPRSKGYRG